MVKRILGSIALSSLLLTTGILANERGFDDSQNIISSEQDIYLPLLFKVAHKKRVNSIKFSADNKTFVTASNDKTAKLWDLDGELIFSMNQNNKDLDQAIFSGDGSLIVTRSKNDKENAIIIYNSKTGEKINIITEKTENNYYYSVEHIEFIPYTNYLVVGTDYNDNVHIYDLSTKQLLRTFDAEMTPDQFAITPNGKKIAIQNYKTVKIFYTANGELYTEFKVDEKNYYNTDNDMEFIDDNKLITNNANGGKLEIWNIKNSQKDISIKGSKATKSYKRIYQIGYISGTDKVIINYRIAYNNYHIDIFTINGKYIGTLKNVNNKKMVTDFDISPNKTKLGIAYENGDIQVFDIRSLINNDSSASVTPEIENLEVILKDSNTLNVKFQAIQN